MNKGLKITALLFFMLASVSILAHNVIFHHHLDDIQHIVQCNHTHCHGNIEDCSLAHIYVKPYVYNQTFLPHNYDFEYDFEPLPCFFTLFSGYSIPQIAEDIGLSFRQKPYLISYHSKYISQSLGLRAPPAC